MRDGACDWRVRMGLTSSMRCDAMDVKDMMLPVEVHASVELFRQHVKCEHDRRKEVARMSFKPLLFIRENSKCLKQQLLKISKSICWLVSLPLSALSVVKATVLGVIP